MTAGSESGPIAAGAYSPGITAVGRACVSTLSTAVVQRPESASTGPRGWGLGRGHWAVDCRGGGVVAAGCGFGDILRVNDSVVCGRS
jgi:hypothetical protein